MDNIRSKEGKDLKALSRRSFIKGAAASAATLAVGSLLAGCAAEDKPAAAGNQGEARTWDKETDVLILGAGGAGMCAGYEACKAGVKALILEKTESFGGTSIRSGGIIQASSTAAQKKLTAYQDDTADKHARYYLQEGEGTLDEALVSDMTAGSAGHIEWLESLGLEFTSVTGSAHVPMADESLYADRIHGTAVGASGMFTAVHDAAESAGAEFLYQTEATKLIVENGRVAGAEAISGGKTISIKAHKGVIIATSSIDHNQQMCKALSPNQYYDNEHSVCAAAPGNTGDGIRMAAQIGGQLSHFGGVIDLTGKTSAGINRQTPLMPCFFVNKYGRRFECEDSTYALTSRELWREMTRTNHACYTICGPNETMTKEKLDEMVASGKAFTGATLAELAAQIDVDADNLQATMDHWNKDITETGTDRQFKRATGLAVIEGPYYAFEEGFMNLGSIGGLKITLNCEVLDNQDQVIPGLYAAGMASAGWLGPFYPGSGTALLGAIHFGRKAGTVVAAL